MRFGGGVWEWERNNKEICVWMLCSNQMGILPVEIVEKIASYLYDAKYVHSACNQCMEYAQWIPLSSTWGNFQSISMKCTVDETTCTHITPPRYPLAVRRRRE